jgi:hypothetical protein
VSDSLTNYRSPRSAGNVDETDAVGAGEASAKHLVAAAAIITQIKTRCRGCCYNNSD